MSGSRDKAIRRQVKRQTAKQRNAILQEFLVYMQGKPFKERVKIGWHIVFPKKKGVKDE